MKRIIIFLTLCNLIPLVNYAQDAATYRTVTNNAFKRGEELTYRIHYGAVNAGVAVMTIDNSSKLINGRPTLHVIGTGTSKGAFDWVFKVRDRYESYMDEEALMPWLFLRSVNEGGFKINQNQAYDHNNGKVMSNGKSLVVPKYVQDMLSAFYYARTMDFSKAKKGDTFEVKTFIDDEIWDLKIKYLGKEIVNSDLGKINCIKFCPVVQKGRVFKKEEDLTLWISDDANHIPVRAEGEILVGSIKMDLIHVAGLAGDMNMVK
ncbi:MAG TPA: DUF3108 domain-containing protein [Bacteroidia bacterium]|nr:DUF3108 domain-containing protein [Bacteroidia bacterium]